MFRKKLALACNICERLARHALVQGSFKGLEVPVAYFRIQVGINLLGCKIADITEYGDTIGPG